jgi:hypothetical protein
MDISLSELNTPQMAVVSPSAKKIKWILIFKFKHHCVNSYFCHLVFKQWIWGMEWITFFRLCQKTNIMLTQSFLSKQSRLMYMIKVIVLHICTYYTFIC